MDNSNNNINKQVTTNLKQAVELNNTCTLEFSVLEFCTYFSEAIIKSFLHEVRVEDGGAE